MTAKPELFTRIEQTFSQLTPSEKRVAGWLLAHAVQIPFETADGIAKATGTSGITVGRYLRKLGFRNLEDAKASLRELPVVPYQPWGMNERLDSWHQQQSLPDLRRFYALHSSWRMRKPCTSSGSSPPAGSLTPFLVTWNICDLKSATPKGFPAVGWSR